MDEVSARAMLGDFPADGGPPALTTIPRREVEEALRAADGPPDLVLDVTRYAGEGDARTAETGKVSIAWTRQDLEELLRKTDSDSVTLAFDAEALTRAFEGEVEAHGIRELGAVLAIAVAAGSAAGVAAAQPAEQAGVSGYAAIEQIRTDPGGTPPGAVIEAVRSADAATQAAAQPAADIEAVRSAEAVAGSDSLAAGLETFRSAETAIAASGPAADIEAVRTAEIAASASTLQAAADIEAVRSASAQAARASADASGGISVSMPSPATTGALAGGIALLITGAAFAAVRRRPGARPA
jgi:hypothetical protein